MKPQDTVTMAHVASVLHGFLIDATNGMEGRGSPDFEFANHAANCARTIARRFGIPHLREFAEAARPPAEDEVTP